MKQGTPYIAKTEWAKALGKAFSYLQDMTIPGTASEAHAQAKGLIKAVFDSLELEAMQAAEKEKEHEAEKAQLRNELAKFQCNAETECCQNGHCEEATLPG